MTFILSLFDKQINLFVCFSKQTARSSSVPLILACDYTGEKLRRILHSCGYEEMKFGFSRHMPTMLLRKEIKQVNFTGMNIQGYSK
jgi:hypothetical protein